MVDVPVREQMLAPPLATSDLAGVGGRIKARCEDFVVDEIPAYPRGGGLENTCGAQRFGDDGENLDRGKLAAYGKRLSGSRRPVQVSVEEFRVDPVEADADLPEGLELRLRLPAGSYATQLIRELQCGPRPLIRG